jgi:ubiquinone biosynthesis UbiH/UbiF/VisC/COQ6 family hydroxylase
MSTHGAQGVAAGPGAAVVGTSVVGLATALGCAQSGVPVTLIGPCPVGPAGKPSGRTVALSPEAGRLPAEAGRQPGEGWDPRIYAISAASRELLERERVWGQVDPARCCAVMQMKVFGDDGGHLQFDARAAGVECLATICEERQLLQALWLGCSMAPNITHLEQGFASARFEGGSVRLALQDGRRLDCELLLGADGKHSAVRAAAGISAHTRSYGHTALVANFECERAHHGVAYQWFTGAEGVVALLPLPGPRVSLVWSAPSALAPELESLSAEAFAERVARRSLHALGDLRLLGAPHAFELNRIAVDRLVAPGIALLGDAAHVVHPLAGQGLNLGLQDVSDLLRCLREKEAWRKLGDLVWLRRYERSRAEPVALMRGTVGGLAWLFDSTDRRLRLARNVGLSAVDRLAPLKHALIRHAMG